MEGPPSSKPWLLVWDFDLSLASEANTDTWIVKHFNDDLFDWQRSSTLPWTQRMDEVMRRLHVDHNVSHEDVRNAFVQHFPFSSHLEQFCAHCPFPQAIVSDANTLFIQWVLQGRPHSLHNAFSPIITNDARVDDSTGRIRISAWHNNDGCIMCPQNMCKTVALRSLLQMHYANHRVVYVGDGRGDVCPCVNVECVEKIFARDDYALHEGLKKRGIQHTVWKDAQHLATLLKEWMQNQ